MMNSLIMNELEEFLQELQSSKKSIYSKIKNRGMRFHQHDDIIAEYIYDQLSIRVSNDGTEVMDESDPDVWAKIPPKVMKFQMSFWKGKYPQLMLTGKSCQK
jgi:hypothetical protein